MHRFISIDKILVFHTDGRTDRRTDQRTDGPTDMTSYKDAYSYRKICG